jgi:hypothetical protein
LILLGAGWRLDKCGHDGLSLLVASAFAGHRPLPCVGDLGAAVMQIRSRRVEMPNGRSLGAVSKAYRAIDNYTAVSYGKR